MFCVNCPFWWEKDDKGIQSHSVAQVAAGSGECWERAVNCTASAPFDFRAWVLGKILSCFYNKGQKETTTCVWSMAVP